MERFHVRSFFYPELQAKFLLPEGSDYRLAIRRFADRFGYPRDDFELIQQPVKADGIWHVSVLSRLGQSLLQEIRDCPNPDMGQYKLLPAKVSAFGQDHFLIVKVLGKRQDGLLVKLPDRMQLNDRSGPTLPQQYQVFKDDGTIYPVYQDSAFGFERMLLRNLDIAYSDARKPGQWERSSARKEETCVVCQDAEPSQVLACPGFHACLCERCSVAIEKCPLCNAAASCWPLTELYP